MPRTCTVCGHAERAEIDRQLLSSVSIRRIARQFRVSKDAASRHKSHISQAVVKAAERKSERLEDQLFNDLTSLRQKTLDLLQAAEETGNLPACVALVREARQNVLALSELAERAAAKGATPVVDGVTCPTCRHTVDHEKMQRQMIEAVRNALGFGESQPSYNVLPKPEWTLPQ